MITTEYQNDENLQIENGLTCILSHWMSQTKCRRKKQLEFVYSK